MEALLDPRFVFPDLAATAEAMAAGRISVKAGCALARKVTAGEVRRMSMGERRILGPHSGTMTALEELQQFANAHDQRTLQRWAAFALMIESQLGGGDLDPAAAPLGLSNAIRVFSPCVRATGATCPKGAVDFALHAIDSMLRSPACTDPSLRATLSSARASFAACR